MIAQVIICEGTSNTSKEIAAIKEQFIEKIKQIGLEDEIEIITIESIGFVDKDPIVIIYPHATFYINVSVNDVDDICIEHILKGKIYSKKVYSEMSIDDIKIAQKFKNMNFYVNQKRIALRNCGVINPFDIEEYIGRDGYFAIAKVITEMKQQDVIDEITKSGLRGRGGGGFNTGLKWSMCAKSENNQKYVICNGDEGDPGAFMDRAVMEGDPHSIIEGMMIAGYAIGSNQGYIYVRAEYPLAVERLNYAIKSAYQFGLLGPHILGTNFTFNLETRLGAGAFVCGEETALMASIEGERGMPRNKPPFPSTAGLWNKPTIINNVETLANVPQIILKGANWFNKIGTSTSKGTKVFALGGKVNNIGLIEIPMGTTLKDVIFGLGGGIPNNKKFKAVQTGGPSGGCLTEDHLNTPIDYDNLIQLGSMMGSGGMIVMDEDNCMVDVARFFLEFTVDESCGKCTPCREGTKRMLEILKKITEGNGSLEDLRDLEELAYTIKDSALCGLGQSAPNPVISTLKYFYDEYYAHVVEKKCPAGVCKALIKYYITDKCKGCGKCKKNCPAGAISGDIKSRHTIDSKSCIKCGACKLACSFGAIVAL